MALEHASCIALGGKAVLIRGPSGSGKSDLALRLIDGGAELLADDYTLLTRDGEQLIAAPPDKIAGRIEVRGVGLVCMPSASDLPVALVIDLVGRDDVERLPAPRDTEIEGVRIPLLELWPFAASAAAKVRLVLEHPVENLEQNQ
ncbi:MAG: HPr kinase/phosphatase C-terminal domain-containing protein [Proteobacteria bacterium]|nr:HPr kinase/phosphatase C-terminal domain-containing protein [Pseudomonadota bacterium]